MPSFKKYGIMIAVMLMALVTMPMSALAADVATSADLRTAFANGGAIKLTANISTDEMFEISKDVSLDLAGYKISGSRTENDSKTYRLIKVTSGAKVHVLSSNGNGTIEASNLTGTNMYQQVLTVYGNQKPGGEEISSTLTIDKDVTIRGTVYGIVVIGKGSVLNIMEGATIIDNTVGISGNGTVNKDTDSGGTTINIFGGKITGSDAKEGLAIYHPQSGILNISGGEFSGYDGVQMKSGTFNMTGGKITASGNKPDTYPDSSNGPVVTASAISIISNINYTGAINIDISGNAVLESKNACAVFSKITVGDATHFNGITISGGTFTGGDKSLLLNDNDKVKIAVTGGVYNSDPTAYVASGYVARKATDSKYVVTKEGTLGKVALSPATLTLKVSETGTVSAVAAVTGEEISWTTNDSSVATVAAGKVTAVKAGIAVITAKGDVTKSSASCIVTVTDPANTDTTPTPAPVEPTIVTKENNPITTDTNVPETVKPATPVITEANEANITALAASADIAKEHLVATANGLITISPAFAQDAVKSLMSDDATVQPKAIATLPIVKAEVDKGLVAALAFTVKGSDLYADKDNIVSDINLIKILKDKTAAKFTYVSDPAAYDDKCFTLKDSNGKNLLATDSVAPDKAYTLIVFVKDNGDFDYDKTDGSVIDPMAVATNAATVTPTPTPTSSSGSSSGCNAGVAMLALLALVPLAYRRKK